MGWWGKPMEKPRSRKELQEHLLEQFKNAGWETPTEVLAHRLIGNTWYAKVRTTLPDGSEKLWFAITLLRWEDGCLWTKEMDNTVGPAADDCPISWFTDVPVEGEYDQHWRDRCIAKQERAKKVAKMVRRMRAGDLVTFSGQYGDCDKWYYSGIHWLFSRTPDGRLTRLRNWRKYLLSVTRVTDAETQQNIPNQNENTQIGGTPCLIGA